MIINFIADVPEPPVNVIVVGIQSRSIALSWTEPHDNNAPIQGYFVFFEEPSFAGGDIVIVSTSQENAVLTDLFPGVEYTFTVVAYNAIGNSSESESVQVRTDEEGELLISDSIILEERGTALYTSL